uniref:Uncharacterized protein n=1 Tax=Pectinophora gossypiella TaxID=13191 RepID=A0A1E1W0D0_PECGO
MARQPDFVEYVNSVVNLDALEKMTADMDEDIEESQKLMDEIKTLFDSIPTQSKGPTDNGLRHEDLSQFLEAGVPKLLMPDMAETNLDVDLDDVISTMKDYAEDLKRTCSISQPKTAVPPKDMGALEIDQYATTLDQLVKRLANIKLSKNEADNRNPELEDKLTQLGQDVNMFTQMIQSKTKLTECDKNWPESQPDSPALQYKDIISKLLSGINEVTYLLQNKN